MKKRGKIIAVVLTLVLTISMVACGDSSTTETPAESTEDSSAESSGGEFFGTRDKSQEYYFVTYASGAAYFTYIQKVWNDLGDKLGVTTKFAGVTGADLTELAQVMDQIVATKPAGIMFAPPDAEGCVEMINKAVAAGVPVVTVESDSPDSDRYSYLSNDPYVVGQVVADGLADAIGAKGRVCVVTDIGPSQHNLRVQGFKERIEEKYPDMTLDDAGILNAEVSTELATELTTAYLQANPDTVGIYSGYAEMTTGVLTALNDLGKNDGSVKVMAVGEDEVTCLAIKSGDLYASVTQSRYNETYWSLMMLYALHNGYAGEMENFRESGAPILPIYVNPGYAIMTAENVDYYIDTYFGGPID